MSPFLLLTLLLALSFAAGALAHFTLSAAPRALYRYRAHRSWRLAAEFGEMLDADDYPDW